MKKIIPALAMLLISAIVMSTASFAWFTMSETASAQGMEINAIAGGALLIDKAGNGFVGASTVDLSVFNTASANLDAITADATSGYVYATDAAKEQINPAVGALPAGENVTAPVPANKANSYYRDYVVYLAAGTSYTASELSAEVTFDGLTTINDTLKATTVDFYYATMPYGKDAAHNEVKPTIALAAEANDGTAVNWTKGGSVNATTATDTSLSIRADVCAGELTIPAATTGTVAAGQADPAGTIAVLMRVYFDGDASFKQGDADIYYVRTDAINADDVSVSANFTATEKVTQ